MASNDPSLAPEIADNLVLRRLTNYHGVPDYMALELIEDYIGHGRVSLPLVLSEVSEVAAKLYARRFDKALAQAEARQHQ